MLLVTRADGAALSLWSDRALVAQEKPPARGRDEKNVPAMMAKGEGPIIIGAGATGQPRTMRWVAPLLAATAAAQRYEVLEGVELVWAAPATTPKGLVALFHATGRRAHH